MVADKAQNKFPQNTENRNATAQNIININKMAVVMVNGFFLKFEGSTMLLFISQETQLWDYICALSVS